MTVIADDRGVHDIGGIMGGEHSRRHRGDHRHPHRMRLFRSRAYRADRPEARPHLRRAQPLRARRRSRLPRARPGARDGDGARAGRRRGVAARPRRRRRRRSTRSSTIGPARCARAGRRRRARGPAGRRSCSGSASTVDPRRSAGGSRCRHGVATSTAPADIVEEVARIQGFDKVPSTPLPRAPGVARPTATAEQMVERRSGAPPPRAASTRR